MTDWSSALASAFQQHIEISGSQLVPLVRTGEKIRCPAASGAGMQWF